MSDVTHKRALASGLRATGKGPAKVYQGGSYTHLHAMLGIEVGSRLLYAGRSHLRRYFTRQERNRLAHDARCSRARARDRVSRETQRETARPAKSAHGTRRVGRPGGAPRLARRECQRFLLQRGRARTRETVVRHRAHGAPRGHARVPPRVSLRLGTTHEGGFAKFTLRVSSRAILRVCTRLT